MTRDEFLKSCGKFDDVTFIIAKAVKDANTPFYHMEYQTTPIFSAEGWLENLSMQKKNYIVIKKDHAPIDASGIWTNWYKKGRLKCALITTEEDLFKLYSEKQGKDMIEMYARKAEGKKE